MIVLLSGPIASGKSTLSLALQTAFDNCVVLQTSQLVKMTYPDAATRHALQQAGSALDVETGGAWIANKMLELPTYPTMIIDAIRTLDQITHIRNVFCASHMIKHIHLTALPGVLRSRFQGRDASKDVGLEYEEASSHVIETSSSLAKVADAVIDTTKCTPQDVVTIVSGFINGPTLGKNVDVLVGGQYGSEGKGQISAFIAPRYRYLVRVGGPNAGHKVWTPKGNVCFHHLPSGTLANPGANILIGAGAVINVNSFLEEVAEFNVEHRLSIDPNAIIIDNDDIKYEKALVSSIGSTGQGVGRATSRKILRTAASPDVVLAKDHPKLKPFITPIQVLLGSAYYHGHKVLLEGTQGTSLSIHHGHYPYVTSRDTTASGTLSDAGIPPHRVNKVIMVCRTHPIRVKSPEGSTSGPMEQEIDLQHVARNTGIDVAVLEKTETTSTTKLRRRIAEFDWVQLHKSCQLNGPTDIALTFVDYIDKNNAGARRLSDLSMDTIRFIETIEIATGVPVSLISTMFHREGVIDLRKW